MNRLREVKLYIHHQHSMVQNNRQIHIVPGCLAECIPWVWHSEATQSPWHKPESRMEMAFSYICPVPGLSYCILLEVWQHKSLALFRVWNWEQRGQRKKHQVPLWFSKWIADRMQCPWEEAIGHGRRRVSQSDSLGQSDSDHTDCHSCSQKKNWSDFRVWIAPVSNSQAQTFVWLIPGGTVGDLPFLSS